jgi:hypothetical protein
MGKPDRIGRIEREPRGRQRNAAVSRPTHASINARRQRRSASSGGTAIGKDSEAIRVVSTVMRRASTRAAS